MKSSAANPTPDFLFAALDLERPSSQGWIDPIRALPGEAWWRCPYRGCDLLPLFTENGGKGRNGTANTGKPWLLNWVDWTPEPIRRYCEDVVFPWAGGPARVNLIRTLAGAQHAVHIDCYRSVFGTRQHKFRYVIQGRTDTLYFVTRTGHVSAPQTDLPFIMDGSWPHGMNNFTRQEKITLAIGAPWTGKERYDFKGPILINQNFELPENYDELFEQ